MSFASCFRYVLGLPPATLTELLRATIAEGETAGLDLTFVREDQPIGDGSLTADITATLVDEEPRRATLHLPGDPLAVALDLRMRIEVAVQELELDVIEYLADFQLLGVFRRDEPSDGPTLVMEFAATNAGNLGLAVSGGAIPIGSALVESYVDDLVAADPTLVEPAVENENIPTIGEVQVTTQMFHDDPGDPDFRGRITASLPDDTTVRLAIPGHLRMVTISSTLADTDMTIAVDIAVAQSDGELRVLTSGVQAADVSVTFGSINPLYELGLRPIVQQRVAERFQAQSDLVQELPADAELAELIATEIVSYAHSQSWKLFDPQPPAADDDIDLTSFVPATIGSTALALQLEPLDDGTPCDAVDDFVRPDGFSMAIAAIAVRPLLDDVVSQNEGLTRSIQGHDVTVVGISAELADPGAHGQDRGHLWIEGNADVAIDCWPDAGVEFWGPVFLTPVNELDGAVSFDADTGEFGAEDDTSCEDVNPDDIAALIDDQSFRYQRLPTEFGGVGTLQLTVDQVEIFAAGMRLFGGLAITTLSTLGAGSKRRKRAFWGHEAAAGG